jgi:hypothetical protein
MVRLGPSRSGSSSGGDRSLLLDPYDAMDGRQAADDGVEDSDDFHNSEQACSIDLDRRRS